MNKAQLIAEKKVIEMFKLSYLDYRDKRKVDYVVRSLRGTNAKLVEGNSANPNEVIMQALSEFRGVFGIDIANKTAAKIPTTPLKAMNPISHCFTVNVQYDYDDTKREVVLDSGVVDHIKFPYKMSGEDSVFLGHEFVHMNKELNFDEYKSLMVCSDVLTMLYEFIVMGDKAKIILNNRLFFLNAEVRGFESSTEQIKKSGKEKDLYKLIQSRSGQYLNSFYYATILYKMYQENPSLILKYMKRVLNREITTLDMLNELGLYLNDNNAIYDEQLSIFKRIIK